MKLPIAQVLLAMGLLTTNSAGAATRFDPANATIGRLRAALDAGDVTSAELVQYYLERIGRLDRGGPALNALITLNRGALAQASQRDAERSAVPHRSPLYGIPFIVKDNFDTKDLPTTGGSAALRGSVPPDTAFAVQKLLDRGAILIGKANMSELAASYGRLGYSSAGGVTRNPYNTARDASGSSSGSAAAVAADFAAFALGTDTAGSVRSPASVTGLVGLRPTLGLVSRSGVIPSSLTFDTPGVLARSAEDAALVLDVIAVVDPRDAATLDHARPRTTYAVQGRSLDGVRLGAIGNFRGGNPEVDAIERAALQRLAALGAVVVPVTLPPEFATLWETVLAPVGEAEFKLPFERYLRTLAPQQPHTLAALIQINESPPIANSPHPVNPPRLAALREADDSALTDSPAYIRILTRSIPALRERLQNLAVEGRLEAFVFSTMSCPASPRFDRADPTYVCNGTDPYAAGYVAAAAGFPEISAPAGRVSANVPVGLSFLGVPDGEARLLELVSAFERGAPARPPPPLD